MQVMTGFGVEACFLLYTSGWKFFKHERGIGKRDDKTLTYTDKYIGKLIVSPIKMLKMDHLFTFLNHL